MSEQITLAEGAPNMQEEPIEPRLDPDQILEVCNRVRAAGGGELLDALLPGVALVEHSCLIARNLNFGCEISPYMVHQKLGDERTKTWTYRYDDGEVAWFMDADDPEILDTIAEAMEWPIEHLKLQPELEPEAKRLLLPRELGRAATAFDRHEMPVYLYTAVFEGRVVTAADSE